MDILAAIEHQERTATAYGSLEDARTEAIDHYLGRPYGDEVDGRSQVVMRDVHDTVEWIKPSLMKVFASGDEVVRFDPVGPEDEEQAEQETQYVNHILMQKNQGFMVLHDWFHDALIQKVGYVVVGYEEEKLPTREPYKGLTDDEFAFMASNPEFELIEHGEYVGENGMRYHDAVFRKVQTYGCVRVRNIPPERVLVASDWPDLDLQGCPFVEVVEYRTISDLRQQGYDVPDEISDDDYARDDYAEARRNVELDGNFLRDDVEADPATRRVRCRKVWIRFDADGDGLAELRRVVVVGDTILEDEEDDTIPVVAITPQRVPHEHYGLSVDDMVSDLQRIRTVLVRGFLDNMYLANSGRNAVDSDRVNIEDLLVSRPGGIVRVQGDPGSAIVPLQHVQQGPAILQAIEYVDNVRESRTGVGRSTQGLDRNALNSQSSTATQAALDATAAQQRIEMIARVFAESGVKNLMLLIHAISLKHTRQAEMVKLRNKWVPIDPRMWRSRRDMTVSVGLGTGNKDQMLGHLNMIWQMQLAGMQFGIANPKNLYETASKLTNNAGFKTADEFWSNPEEFQPPPPPPSPEQIKAQTEMQKLQFQAQTDAQKFQAEQAADQQKFQAQQILEQQKLQMQAELDRNREELDARQKQLEAQQKAELEKQKSDNDLQLQAAKMELERWKAELDATVKLQVAQMGQQPAPIDTSVLDTLAAIAQAVNELAQPAQILRDAAGKAIGVQRGQKIQQLIRDEQGRAAGLQ